MSSLRSAIDQRLAVVEAREEQLQALVGEPHRSGRLVRDSERADASAPLAGWFAGIKDILHVDGLVTRAGTGLPHDLFARDREAACVAALRGAGALILGKTVTTEFAYFEPGPTCNPHNPAHTPGGSSSGSAAAVAAGYCELALGTQTVGSVIRPAAFCGVVGFKPSYGRIDTDGLLLCAPSVDTIGLFGPTVDYVLRGAGVVVDGWASQQGETRPVLGIPDGPYLTQALDVGQGEFDRQVAHLESAGFEVRRVPILDEIDDINTRHSDLQAAEMALEHQEWMADHLGAYRPRTREILLRGQQVSASRLKEARDGRAELRQQLHKEMDAAGVDVWICPSATGPAPEGLHATGDPVMNLPWTHSGLPVVSLPAGWVGDLPVGLQCVARFGADEQLLAWTVGLEEALRPLASAR